MRIKALFIASPLVAGAVALFLFAQTPVTTNVYDEESQMDRRSQDYHQLAQKIAILQQKNAELKQQLTASGEVNPEPMLRSIDAASVDSSQASTGMPVVGTAKATDALRKAFEVQESLSADLKVEDEYTELLDTFDLSQDERINLTELLKRRILAESISPLDLLSGQGLGLDQNHLDELRERQQIETEKVHAEIREYLTDEAYAEYEFFHATRSARREADQIQYHLISQGRPLTEAQRIDLIEIIHNARQGDVQNAEVEALADLQTFLRNPTQAEAAINGTLDKVAISYNDVLEASDKILEEDQYTALHAYYENNLEQEEKQAENLIKMAPLFQTLMNQAVIQSP